MSAHTPTRARMTTDRSLSEGKFSAARFALATTLGMANKPMVPTAPASPIINPLHPLRRHIGQSLDCQRERRQAAPYEEHESGRK
jgi:hypothetical protein